jgi:hypothetical protein
MRITNKEKFDYEKTFHMIHDIISLHSDYVTHDITKERLYDWLEYTYEIESKLNNK